MEKSSDSLYYKGYVAGYRAGVADAVSGKASITVVTDFSKLPLNAMKISTRAIHVLSLAGCEYIEDVMNLSDHRVATMRNLGPKTASEIAHWFDDQGIRYTAWNHYL